MAFYRKRGSTWEYRISYIERKTGKQKEKTKGGFTTKPEAKIAAAAAELELAYYGFAPDGNELVSTFFDKWLEVYKKPNVKPITYSVQERNVRLNILPRWGHLKMRDITRNDYQEWINELRQHYSEGTTRRIHSIMSSALNDAVHDFNIIRENPLQKIKIPKETEATGKVQYFTREQLDLFLQHTKPVKNSKYQESMQYTALFTLLSRTGLRIGEALALTWNDIDLDKKTLTVNKTLVYPINSKPYLSTPKTATSGRTIKMDDAAIAILKKHRINRKEVVLRYAHYKAPESDIVFFQQDGRWLRTNVVRDYFKTVCKRAGVPVLSPHALRHSHAVHLLEAGANIKYVSERLGHKSVKITADTYLHVTQKIEDDALNLYARYVL
ncbi:site-specific integrase [Cohnella fermenti]|uniref:Site-specific integrase n=1 Tax=Cohnella fermenti TaxID=2565925 RepID=A0A4S4C6Z4_9BACL|nr:site-specific integrase [Cohnella fermenti]THF83708.1 site-specific integrase [Cohnella fermenti]